MAKQAILKAAVRSERGTGAARRLRRQGKLPAILTMIDGSNVPITLAHHEFDMALRGHSADNILVDVELAGAAPIKALLLEVQREGNTGATEHADFREVSMTAKMRVHVPVQLVGDPAGVLTGGGILDHMLREIEVEVLPGDMVDFVQADVSGLNVGDTLLVRDLVVSAKLTVLTAGDMPVATVVMPKQVEEEKPAEEGEAVTAEGAAETTTAAEPELVTKKKKTTEDEEKK
jgi:large subunit ribosomal protein L25